MVGMWPGPWQAGVGSIPPTALTGLSSWIPITDSLGEGRAGLGFSLHGLCFQFGCTRSGPASVISSTPHVNKRAPGPKRHQTRSSPP